MLNTIIDALEELETHAGSADFAVRWRAFLRECALALADRLPLEVRPWIEAADAYEQGAIDASELEVARVAAWRFHDGMRAQLAAPVIAGLRVVMYRLWPDDGTDWFMSARHFLDFFLEAGLPVELFHAQLQRRFGDLLAGATAGR
ncbi:MAG TPA: hypothetical protein VMJ10_29895 [Kofleriaceae bacterium]|nr:hypothetical protein [Kofleriaceae bacterium]